MPGTLSTDHDDYYGGIAEHAADRTANRSRSRITASVGTRGGRRAAILPTADAVSDASSLYLPGAIPAEVRAVEPEEEEAIQADYSSARNCELARDQNDNPTRNSA